MVGGDKKEILENQPSPSTPFCETFLSTTPSIAKTGCRI